MWQYRPTEELYHYGVPGMKWGVRKATKGQFKIDKKSKVALGVVGGTVAAGGILGAAFTNKFFNKYGKQAFTSSEIKLQTLAGGAKGAAFAALGMIGAYGVDSIASKARTSKNNGKRRTKHN